ncbi:hypothetical protein G6F65_013669 [Rhizopus arrhizus]|nr:hypothetical protein G6F65_013669 [Rhizopus arrhizus]
MMRPSSSRFTTGNFCQIMWSMPTSASVPTTGPRMHVEGVFRVDDVRVPGLDAASQRGKQGGQQPGLQAGVGDVDAHASGRAVIVTDGLERAAQPRYRQPGDSCQRGAHDNQHGVVAVRGIVGARKDDAHAAARERLGQVGNDQLDDGGQRQAHDAEIHAAQAQPDAGGVGAHAVEHHVAERQVTREAHADVHGAGHGDPQHQVERERDVRGRHRDHGQAGGQRGEEGHCDAGAQLHGAQILRAMRSRARRQGGTAAHDVFLRAVSGWMAALFGGDYEQFKP